MCSWAASALSRSIVSLALKDDNVAPMTMAVSPLRKASGSGKQLQIGHQPLIALDAVLATCSLRLFENHQNRGIGGFEDTQIAASFVEFGQFRLDRKSGQPLGDVDQLDQPRHRDSGRFDFVPHRLGSSLL